MNFTWLIYALFASITFQTVFASNQVVVYWGQGSSNEASLRSYCTDSSIDIIVMGFVYLFPTAPGSSYPGLNFAGHCNNAFSSSDPYFLDCSADIAPDVSYCQAQGKKVILSFGGAVGTYGFTGDSQAQSFADTVWNMFLGGSGVKRPFGNVVLDGVDLDIESGATTGYAAFITQLRSHFTSQSAKTYTISGAPQCVYPDALLGPGTGTALQSAWFDYVWVQFYNNYCGLDAFGQYFNYANWNAWATSTSVNPNVKLFIGAPASSSAAGSGYVSAATLKTISNAMISSYPSNYGGIMLWDAGSQAANGNFASQLAAFLHTGSSTPSSTPASTPSSTPASTPSSPSSTPSSTPAQSPVTPSSTSTSAAAKTSTTTGKKATTTTTGKKSSTSTSTGRVTSTGKAASTTTTGAAAAPTPAPVISSPSAPVSAPVSSPVSADSGSCANNGWMKCASSNTYQVCNWGQWAAVQSCPTGLQCSPSGDYIYCV